MPSEMCGNSLTAMKSQGMRFAVLHAHPLDESLSATLREQVVETLKSAGHEVNLVRLTQGDWIDTDELESCEGLIFVYPTWWGGLPAPMLHWVQVVLAPWIDHGAPKQTSPLRNVKALVAVTTHGSTRWVNRLQGEPGLQLLKRTIRKLCAPRTKLRWIAHYNIDRSTENEIAAFIHTVGTKLKYLVVE